MVGTENNCKAQNQRGLTHNHERLSPSQTVKIIMFMEYCLFQHKNFKECSHVTMHTYSYTLLNVKKILGW